MLRILLVDDEPLVLIGLQGMLEWEKLGYTVCGTARNGKLALELIEREKPDIVIADVKMPVMDGLTLAIRSVFSCGCTPGCSRTKPHWSSLCSTWS